MAHIQRRCPRCRKAVSRGNRSCSACGGTEFTWRVRYVDPDGREKSRSFRRKADADDFATEVAHTLRSSSYVDPAAGRQTLRAYLDEWRGMQSHHRTRTVDAIRSRFENMVYPYPIAKSPLNRLTPSTMTKWQAALLAQGYAAASVLAVRGQLATALNDAVRDRRIPANPFTGVKALEPEKKKVVPRTVAQVEAGRRAIRDDRYRAVIRADAGSGLRFGELFGLTVDRVDFLRKEITVDRQLCGRNGAVPIFGPPKTKKSNRVVPVGDVVIRELAAHLAKFPARPGPGLWVEPNRSLTEISHAGLIFLTRQGTPVTRGTWANTWRPVQAAMGLADGEGLHQLRHFYASLLIADGRSVIEVQERLGHATAQETWDTYSHLFPDADEGTRKAIDAAFQAAAEKPGEAAGNDQ